MSATGLDGVPWLSPKVQWGETMLLPASSNIATPSATARATNQGDAVRRTVNRMTDASVAQADSGADTVDLATAIANSLEQDLDYQILRKCFALESGKVTASRMEAEASAGATLGRNLDSLDLHLGQAAATTNTVDLQATWTQVSDIRFELSAFSGDANFALQVQGARRETLELNVSKGDPAPVQLGDPLVLDLGGQGLMTTGLDAGVSFDLNGDGRAEQMSTVTGDSWFLALDWNDNGRIDDGRELFGDQNGAAQGFAELARHDANGDGAMDAADPAFSRLRLVQLKDDGSQVTQTLREAGVTSIALGYQNTRKALDLYDQVAQTSHFTREDGSQGEAADVLLGYRDHA